MAFNRTMSMVLGISLAGLSGMVLAESTERAVLMDSTFSYDILDPMTRITRKQEFLLKNKHKYLKPETLYLGISTIGIADYQATNRDSKFGWLMRHPTANNQVGGSASEVVIHSVQMHATGQVLPWMTAYTEFLYNPEQSFGAGTITSLTRNQVQVRKGYVLLGKKGIPFYVSIGKQDLPFGLMDSVNPFTASTIWHAFGGLAYSGIVGYTQRGFSLSYTFVQGGAQFRAANIPVKGTAVPSRVNNYVLDTHHTSRVLRSGEFVMGLSWIRGSAYNQDFPVIHFNPGVLNNSAYDVYTKFKCYGMTLLAELAQTTKKWPGTHNPSPPLNQFAASKVTSFNLGYSYEFRSLMSRKPLVLSVEFSRFKAGPTGAPWDKQSQLVAGVAYKPKRNVKLFFEFVQVQGYVPLNRISGDHNGVAGTTHSDRTARSQLGVVGIQATL